MRISPYLHFQGNCAEAFNFYAATLKGEIGMMMTYGDAPPEAQVSDEDRHKVMHVNLSIGDTTLMGSDSPPHYTETPAGFTVSINVSDPAEAERVFAALAEGGSIGMPIQKTFWAQRFGMLKDRFGTPWMVNCE